MTKSASKSQSLCSIHYEGCFPVTVSAATEFASSLLELAPQKMSAKLGVDKEMATVYRANYVGDFHVKTWSNDMLRDMMDCLFKTNARNGAFVKLQELSSYLDAFHDDGRYIDASYLSPSIKAALVKFWMRPDVYAHVKSFYDEAMREGAEYTERAAEAQRKADIAAALRLLQANGYNIAIKKPAVKSVKVAK